MVEFAEEMKACPSCRGERLRPLDYVYDNRMAATAALVSGCETCGLVFVNPPPAADELDAYYRPGGAWDAKLEKRDRVRAKKLAKLEGKARGRPDRTRIRTISTLLREQYGASQVIDFGCGDGRLLDSLQRQGWETAGIDPISAHSITRHRMLDALPATPSCDLVIFDHVLEHLADPLAVLRDARACLGPNGHVLIGVPTLDGLAQHGKKTYCVNRAQHISAYTRRSLENLLALAGFAVTEWFVANQPFRLRLLARVSDSARPIPDPLRDARRAFREAEIAETGWWCAAMQPVRTRMRRALEQQHAHEMTLAVANKPRSRKSKPWLSALQRVPKSLASRFQRGAARSLKQVRRRARSVLRRDQVGS
jgi:SAM-dependent methyltransferase